MILLYIEKLTFLKANNAVVNPVQIIRSQVEIIGNGIINKNYNLR
jgi:hypothetical protein